MGVADDNRGACPAQDLATATAKSIPGSSVGCRSPSDGRVGDGARASAASMAMSHEVLHGGKPRSDAGELLAFLHVGQDELDDAAHCSGDLGASREGPAEVELLADLAGDERASLGVSRSNSPPSSLGFRRLRL